MTCTLTTKLPSLLRVKPQSNHVTSYSVCIFFFFFFLDIGYIAHVGCCFAKQITQCNFFLFYTKNNVVIITYTKLKLNFLGS